MMSTDEANTHKKNQHLTTIQHIKKIETKAIGAMPLQLSKRMNIEQSFQTIVFNCLEQIEVNATGIAHQYDAESLHQMRVGLRRLRCAIKLFDKMLQVPEMLQQELDWLSTQLGTARDWDVFTVSTLPAVINSLPQKPANKDKSHQLMLAALNKTNEKHKAAAAAIRSKRYALLIVYCNIFVQECEWRDAMSKKEKNQLKRKVMKFASNTMQHQQRQLRTRIRRLRDQHQQMLHRIRITAKKTRYAAMFFSSISSSKKTDPYLAKLATIQDELGWIHDAEIAHRLLEELQDSDGNLVSAIRLIRSHIPTIPVDASGQLHKLLRNVSRAKIPI